MPPAITRLFRYGLVGSASALIYYAALGLLVEVARVSVMTSTCAAFLIVAVENYLMQRWWTFRSKAPHKTAFPRFLCMNLAGFSLNGSIMFVGVEKCSFNYLAVQGVAVVAVMLWNFILANYWIFRRGWGEVNALSLGRQEDAAQ